MATLLCGQCGLYFNSKSAYRLYTPKFCSSKCYGLSKRGKLCSTEHKKRVAEAIRKSWTNPEIRRKRIEGLKGRKISEITKSKIGNANKKVYADPEKRKKMADNFRGAKSHFWKGGITKRNELFRKSWEYAEWRKSVFEKDNWQCQKCGARNGNGKEVYLHAHHVKEFSHHIDLRLSVANGITLCEECHRLTENYGSKQMMSSASDMQIL